MKAIKLNPKLAYSYSGLGTVYCNSGNFQSGKEWYLKAIEIDPKYVYAYNGLGVVYFNLSDYKKAKDYYLKAIEIDPKFSASYYNLGLIYYNQEKYEIAKKEFQIYLKLKKDENDFYYKNAVAKLEEIDKILENSNYKIINEKINKIKSILLFNGECITHYTSITTVQFLLLNRSPLRLSEGSFLNDTSEGQELLNFLEYSITSSNNNKGEEIFTKRPFIGSFVDAQKNNDLTLWRMYGKEALEEAKGCSITINALELKQKIIDKINPKKDGGLSKGDDIEFYRVAYKKDNSFDFAGSTKETEEKLNKLMNELKKEIKIFQNKKNKNKNEEVEIIELLNRVAYLFKSVEYQYENEIRLVINEGIGFDKIIDFDFKEFKTSQTPFKVYIELVPVLSLLKTITIGPKVNKAEEWASTFHYYLSNKNIKPEIHISRLPFK